VQNLLLLGGGMQGGVRDRPEVQCKMILELETLRLNYDNGGSRRGAMDSGQYVAIERRLSCSHVAATIHAT